MLGAAAGKKKIELYRGTGCNNCYNTGYHGRKGVFEIVPVSPTIREMIADRKSSDTIRRQAIKEGMKTLHNSAVNEVLSGATTIEEIMRVINIKAE